MSVEISLRERKKERTRRTIRVEAFRLFREQGYTETTVEQIAAAAEISPSTFFRYFPTKEQLVIADDQDALMIEALAAQPRGLHPLTAFRNATEAVFSAMSAADMAFEQERHALLYHVPELRPAIGLEFQRSIELGAQLMADYTGRAADDFEVRVAAGAMIGTMLAIVTTTPVNAENVGHALRFLQAGLPFGPDDAPNGSDRS
ncbi:MULTISPECIES: TetR family transcriptional regulator [Nocardia]|uniref:TetR family transcriptional regulator n=1 Tax=Nocardia TaxID=1817 RepID=UPI0006FAB9EB|nr:MULTISPECIES: TetR family transcriptional regulator [Nocardia]KQY33132.1 TetR family transcriptional regulator [Nocardia sp. Root136]